MKHVIFLTLCVPLASCNLLDVFGDGTGSWRVQPGAIVFYGDSSSVVIPDTVRAGEAFVVSATTFGGGCTRAAGMRIEVDGLNATLTPVDSVYTPRPDGACTMELKELDHRAEVTFSRAGEARLVVRGVRQGPDTAAEGVEVALQRSVVVH